MGSGPRRVFTSRALSYRRGGHNIRIWRRGRAAGINVDGRYNVSGNAPAHDTKMTTLPYVYIGKCINALGRRIMICFDIVKYLS